MQLANQNAGTTLPPLSCISKHKGGVTGKGMNGVDSTAFFCIMDGICFDKGRIICGIVGVILGALFKHFLELWRQDRKMKKEDENRKKWLRNDYFEKARQYFFGYADNMTEASIIANMPNQNQNIENKLNDFVEFRRLVTPCPFYINDDEKKELFKYADLMDCYMYKLKQVSYYKELLDKFQQWENANQYTISVNSPQYQHESYKNQLNIDAFNKAANEAENIKQIIFSIRANPNSTINKRVI